MDIPPNKLLPQDKVVVYDHGPADAPYEPPVELTMHAVDAKQAIDTDPIRYWLDPHNTSPAASETDAELYPEPPETMAGPVPAEAPIDTVHPDELFAERSKE